ncbi:CRE-SPE-19 protein [Caenorhabditis remanei]|uniref:CRE-SPE-19 protein n=1 Tax=Caenorhabditis remanei TaxID=31234 RepID=E3NB55_CAERE|nr:CRE-SPE-19 protein [Caenorhabditis remanei]
MESYTHCFHSPNNFTFLSLPSGWMCCCSSNKCNWNNPLFFQFFERYILDTSTLMNRIKPIVRYWFCIFFCVLVTASCTFLEILCIRTFGKQKKNSCEEMERTMREEREKQKLLETGSKSPVDPFKSPMPPGSSLQVQPTQSSPLSKPNSEMTIRPDSSVHVDKTQESDPLLETPPKRSELEVASTQRGEDEEGVVPIPQKPACKVTKTGRVQKTSMNYEESTYSDLQD